MIREDRDPAFWNAIANEPETRPLLGPGTEPADLTQVLGLSTTLALTGDHGGFIFVKHEIGRYELHTIISKEGRGAAVLPAFAEAARMVFTTTDAMEIVTRTAGSNRAAALMARRAGFRPIFTRKTGWHDGSGITAYALTIDEWMQIDPAVEAEGHAFHELLEAAKAANGSDRETHPNDPSHDRAAGAAALMAKAGEAAKAAWVYSRWALLAGYQTIELIEDAPPTLDVRDAWVAVIDGRLEVVKCQS